MFANPTPVPSLRNRTSLPVMSRLPEAITSDTENERGASVSHVRDSHAHSWCIVAGHDAGGAMESSGLGGTQSKEPADNDQTNQSTVGKLVGRGKGVCLLHPWLWIILNSNEESFKSIEE